MGLSNYPRGKSEDKYHYQDMFMYLFTGLNKQRVYFSVPVCHVERMEYLKIALWLWSKSPKK